VIKCVVFDFDGTLVESNEIKRKTFYEVTKHIVGASDILDNILSSSNPGDRYDIFDLLVVENRLTKNFFVNKMQLVNSYTKMCEYKISRAPEIKGAIRVINQLKTLGIKVFISSATPEDTLKNIVDIRGWKGVIDEIFGAPDSKIDHLQAILTKNKYSESEVVYVGDSEVDRDAALSVGCKFIGIGKDWSRFSNKPTILLNTFENFLIELKL